MHHSIPAPFQDFRDQIQHNCHIADALHAADYTMCVYLMKMREYFRWERGYGFAEPLSRDEVGDWLRNRESLWEDLEDASFEPLRLEGQEFAVFDAEAVNASLRDTGLVYSAGLGHNNKPHFFLGRLEKKEQQADFTLLVSDQEYARDLTAPPAMTQGDTVYIRRESLQRMVWEKLEEWRWNKLDNPMGRAIQCYDFDEAFEASLHAMTDVEINTLLLHERGEVEAGQLLGGEWESLLLANDDHRTQLLLRSVRDNLADTLSTLPGLIAQGNPASLHFYLATVSSLRKKLFPALVAGYQHWHASGEYDFLQRAIDDGRSHWLELARELLAGFAADHPLAATEIQSLIENKPL